MSEKKNPNPVVHFVAWLVESDQAERARLIGQAGTDGQGGWAGWKVFAVRFAHHYPYSTAFAPVAVALYIFSFYQILGG